MDKTFFDKVCVEYKHNYEKRNLSVNFSKAYEKLILQDNQNCITWYEFQFGNANNEHYDAVIINTTKKEILVIEAKRYNNLPRNIYLMIRDIFRINNFPTEIRNENSYRIPNFTTYKICGVVLADIWTIATSSPKIKELIKGQYASHNFIKTNRHIKDYADKSLNDKDRFDLNNLEITYNVQGFNDSTNLNYPNICNHYFLLSMYWELKI